MKRIAVFALAVFAGASAPVRAYPGPVDGWTWKYVEDGYFLPLQVSAATDPDGRLRTLFLDAQPSYITDGSGSRRVCPPIMQSFRPFPDGTVINEYRGLTVDDYTNSGKKATLASYNAALEPRRTAVYSVAGSEAIFAIGGAYRRLLPSESFGTGRSISHRNHFIPFARRPVVDNVAYEETTADTLAIASVPTDVTPGTVLNEARLEIRSVTSSLPDLTLRFSQTPPGGVTSVFIRSLGDAAPAGWADNRVITGGSLGITSDRRDFYAFVTSYKILSPGGQFTTEARVFRLQTTGGTTDPGGTLIGIAGLSSTVVAESTFPAGTSASSALVYPQIALPNTNEPKWVVWENPGTGTIYAARHVMGTTGSADEKVRTLANGYVGGTGSPLGALAPGSGPSIALDRLNLLHFAYKGPSYAVYGRENGSGGFTSIALFGTCTGAPAVAVGPGQYPYVVYQGTKPGTPNPYNKLVVAYPTGLEAAYKGDHEDRDHDGRSAMLERMQGSSDTYAEPASVVRTLRVATAITEVAPGDRRFEMGFRLDFNAVRQGTSDVWRLADGADILEIRPAYSTNSMKDFFTGGFTVTDEFTVSSSARYMTVRHTTPLGPSAPSRFFRFQVRRIPGPP